MCRPKLTPSQGLLLAFFFFSALTLASQTATVQHSSNLRKSPNTGSAILESLNQGDSVTLTSTKKRLGYYHARASDGRLGWVWGLNVSTGTSNNTAGNASPSPNPGSGLPVQLAAATVKSVPQALVINGHSVCGPTGKPTKPLNSSKNRTDIPDANSYVPVDWNALASLPSGQANKVQAHRLRLKDIFLTK